MLKAVKPEGEGLSGARQANQRRALELLSARAFESAAALSREAGVPESAVRSLLAKGYAAYVQINAPPPALPCYDGKPLTPTAPRIQAVERAAAVRYVARHALGGDHRMTALTLSRLRRAAAPSPSGRGATATPSA